MAVHSGLAPWGAPTLNQAPHLFERALLAGLGKTEPEKGTFSIAYNLVALERSSMALRERLSAAGGEVTPGSTAMFASLLASEQQRYQKLIREARIQPD